MKTDCNNAYSLWNVRDFQLGFRTVASFGFRGQESASKSPQVLCKKLGAYTKMRILIILLLLCNLTFGQKIFSFSIDLPYPDRVVTDSIMEYIAKSDSMWSKYKKVGFQRVDLEYENKVNLQLIYDSLGNGKQFIEFFPDTIAVELSYSNQTDGYTLKKYDWFYGNSFNLEYWYPKDNIIEYWRYDDSENLEKVIKIKNGESIKILEITSIRNFQESTIKYTYRKIDGEWIIDETIEVIEE